MQNFRSDLALAALAVVGVAADLACVLTGHPAPALFDQVALAGLTGAAGVAMQRPDPAPAADQAPASAAPPAPAAVPAPAPYTGPVGQ